MSYKDEIARARYLIINTFGNLIFKEDTHQYFLQQPDGSMKEYDCVSHFTHQFETTDYNQVAINYAEKHGETPEFWRAEWDKKAAESCALGTQVHEFAESLGWLSNNEAEKICDSAKAQYNPLNNKLSPLFGLDKLSLKEQAAEKFWNELHPNLHFVMAETKVYTSVGPLAEVYPNNYAGTFDLLLYYDDPINPNNSGFCIFDYKGLPLDTPIPTKNGFVNMGDLKEGMIVFDNEGKECKILHCSEIHHNPCCKISFDNGDEIVADIDHRWQISINKDNIVKDCVMTTKELKNLLQKKDNSIIYIKNPNPICCNNKKTVSPNFIGTNIALNNKILLETVNLDNYIFSDISYRLSILQGICKHCKSVRTNNQISYTLTIDTINIYEFIISLFGSIGILPSVKKNNESWIVSWCMEKTGENSFKFIQEKDYRIIVSIEDVDMVPTRCIEVDSKSHTYLATKKFIVTHNTNHTLTNTFNRKNKKWLAYPFNDMIEESQSLYALQLNCYQIPLEAIGLKVIARRLVHLDDKGNYHLIPLPYLTNRIKKVLKGDINENPF